MLIEVLMTILKQQDEFDNKKDGQAEHRIKK
jgi:hypothetical protein